MGNIKEINIKNWTYYFFNDIINIKDFNPNLLKKDRKSYKTLIFIILDTSQLKILVIVKVLIVEILCIFLLVTADEHIEEKTKINT